MCFNAQINTSNTGFYVNEKGLCPENILETGESQLLILTPLKEKGVFKNFVKQSNKAFDNYIIQFQQLWLMVQISYLPSKRKKK